MKKIILLVLSIFAWSLAMANDFDSAPAAVKSTVLKHGTAKEVVEFSDDVDEDDKTVYYVTIQKGAVYTYLVIDEAGKLISKEDEEFEDEGDDEEEESEQIELPDGELKPLDQW